MQLSIDFDYNDFFAVPDIKISLDDLCLHHGKVNEHFEIVATPDRAPKEKKEKPVTVLNANLFEEY